MIAAQNLSVEFGGIPLFEKVTWTINHGDRVGLVGSNGAGKTTLLRTLVGEQPLAAGEVIRHGEARIGYLRQEGAFLGDRPVREEVLSARGDLTGTEKRLEELTEEVARAHEAGENERGAELLEELGELQHRYEGMDGFAARGEVEKILMGLGFEAGDLDRPCSEFSGGWQMRIELAKLLLTTPDLLMLDEPTNHLDIESLTWLEEFLSKYPGGILLISHDRSFLDAITTHTYELSNGRLTIYTGNYSRYLLERVERRKLQQAAYDNQQKMIADTERFIERFRYKASKAVQVQSRVKQLEKVERLVPPEPDESEISFRFPEAPRSGRVVVELRDIVKRYGSNLVLDGIDFALERGTKIAFLGRNGEGKSTLSRIIAGIEPHEGERIIGHNVEIGYFAQHQAEDLDPSRTALETLEDVAVGDIRTQLRTLLGTFLFHGDDVFKPVKVLSGGEKSRLALAKLLLQPRNLLVLDEPTNHLDMASKNVMKQALQAFEGALVVVSHDRDFLRGLTDISLDFRDRQVKEVLGGIDDYLLRFGAEKVDDAFARPKGEKQKKSTKGSGQGLSRKEQKRLEAEERNRRSKATRGLRERIERIEKEVGWLEEEKAEVQGKMADPEIYSDSDKIVPLQKRLADIESKLTELYGEWEETASKLEAVESSLDSGVGSGVESGEGRG